MITRRRVEQAKVEAARQMRFHPTAGEKLLWAFLRARRLGGLKFRRQQVVCGFIVDFYCHAEHLAIEVDGSVHDELEASDQRRDQILAVAGIRVLRFTNDQVLHDTPSVRASILATARAVSK